MTAKVNDMKNSSVNFICCNEDFRPKYPQSPPLKPSSDRFRLVELIRKNKTSEDEEEDTNDYVRIQLASSGTLFGKEVDLYVNTPPHPSIVQFKGFEYYPQHLAITSYYPNGSLQHLLKEIREGKNHPEWDGTMKSKCIFGLVAAVTHVHSVYDKTEENFAIRYLCPENIIFDDQNEPKLINYVLGCEMLEKQPNAYISPELHQYPLVRSSGVDVWNIGMILYEILTGKLPYHGVNNDKVKDEVMNGKIPELPSSTPETEALIEIIKDCLNTTPNKRPSPKDILDRLAKIADSLFPDTDKVEYEKYCKKVLEATAQS